MKYSVITFGCRVNQADSLAIEGELRSRGAAATSPKDADVVVVNTCSVTATADQGARQTIRRVVRSNPDVRVIVTGCYATRRPNELRELPNVVRVVENAKKDDLVGLIAGDLERWNDTGCGKCDAHPVVFSDGPCGRTLEPGVAGRTAFTLRVQTGCDEQCSYCIIPKTRGSGRSRPLSDVLREVDQIVSAGYKEIVVTGVHLGSYGRDLSDRTSLTSLVERLSAWPGNVLFRISSLEPMDCTEEIISIAAESPRIAPHFHLPLQHASNELLVAMRRPYRFSDYASLVTRLHDTIPHASIGSDIIVGFPGESDEHFDEMRRALSALPLTHLHVFPYSDRPGTEATRLTPKVEGSVIRDRGREVRAIGETMSRRFKESQVGSVRRALTVDDGRSAVTDNYIKVRLDRQFPRNEWIEVTI